MSGAIKGVGLEEKVEAAVVAYLEHRAAMPFPVEFVGYGDSEGVVEGTPKVEVTALLVGADPPESAMFRGEVVVNLNFGLAESQESDFVTACGEVMEAVECLTAADLANDFLGVNDIEIDGGSEPEIEDNVRGWLARFSVWVYDIEAG